MMYINVRHTVTDYAKWRVAFDADETIRRAAGATGIRHVYRDQDNPNTVTTIVEWDNADKARRFAEDPRLKEVMAKAGVTSTPEVRFLNGA